MTLNLNRPAEVTEERVKDFLRSADGNGPKQIRVTLGGIVFLSDTVDAEALEGLAFRLRRFKPEEVGTSGAQNDQWVKAVCRTLQENWPQPSHTIIDTI